MPQFKNLPQLPANGSAQDLIKYRQICLAKTTNWEQQLDQANAFLSLVKGVQTIRLKKPATLSIKYSLRELSLENIENAFIELGFKLDDRLINRIRRAIYHYCEQTELENRNIIPRTNQVTFSIYASRFKQMSHICRDGKPVNWRRYL